MIMLDYPSSSGCDAILGQWQALSEIYTRTPTKLRSIAVSNFDRDQLACLNSSAIVPVANQLHFCLGAWDSDVLARNAALGIMVQAYSPLGSGSVLQKNVTIATQSTNPKYLIEDADIFDFTLTPDEMAQLDQI